jgi:L-fucose mutarotase/ribose pyranase (RbsD/FucU family)
MGNVLKNGDLIDIFCENGHGSETIISHNGKPINNVIGLKIEVSPNAFVATKIEMISPIIDLKGVKISEIIDANPKIKQIREIVKKVASEISSLDAINKISEILEIEEDNG